MKQTVIGESKVCSGDSLEGVLQPDVKQRDENPFLKTFTNNKTVNNMSGSKKK